jgi:ferredoxin
MSPVAQTYLGISGYIIFWLLFLIAAGLFTQRIILLIRLLKLGRPENRTDHLAFRIRNMVKVVLTQSSNLKSVTAQDPAAIGHAMMFWGLIVFVVAYVIFIGFAAGFGLFPSISGSEFERVVFSILDIIGIFIIASIIWVIIKRYIIKPERLKRHETTEEKVIQAALLAVIMSLMVLYYLMEGFGYAALGLTGTWPPIGTALANAFSGISRESLIVVYNSLWWLNFLLIVVAMVYAPRSKHLHPLTSFANITFQDMGPKGALKPVDLKDTQKVGASKIQDFTWKQLLDGYACTWCGRCHVVCPAQVSGKPLSPRELILGLKDHLIHEGPKLLKAPARAAAGPVSAAEM